MIISRYYYSLKIMYYFCIRNDTIYDHNWRKGGYGNLTLRQALAFSSDIGIIRAVDEAFPDKKEFLGCLASEARHPFLFHTVFALEVQAIWVHQEIINIHDDDALFVLIGRGWRSYDDVLLETIFDVLERIKFLLHFFFSR